MAKNELDLGWLRLFYALGRLNNMTRVAEACGMTQPAVSYQLRRLEDDLGAPLVKRLHRGAELTREGQQLFEAVQESIALIDGAARQIRERNQQATIRIHTDFGFASYWLLPRISEFRKMEPDIEVHVLASQSLGAQQAADADLLITFGRHDDVATEARQLMREQVVPVCAPGYLSRKGPFDNASRLAAETLIHLEGESRTRWFSWQSWLKELGVARKPSSGDLSLNTYNLVIQAALAEQGVALGWIGLVDDLLQAGVLVEAGQAINRPDHGYWLTSNAPASGVVKRLADWLISESRMSGEQSIRH